MVHKHDQKQPRKGDHRSRRPLTDIAILLRAEPSIVDNIEEIVIMGGGHEQRNSTAAAEFNIWKDPEAAEIVMNCGAKITLVPLDATHAASTRLSEVQQYKDLHTPVGDMIAELIEIRTRPTTFFSPFTSPTSAPSTTPSALLTL